MLEVVNTLVQPLHNFMLNACFTIPWDDIFKIYCRSNRVKKIDNWRIICYYGHCPALKKVFA